MTEAPKRFPLTLAALVDAKSKTSGLRTTRIVATPQTATRNAASDSAKSPSTNNPYIPAPKKPQGFNPAPSAVSAGKSSPAKSLPVTNLGSRHLTEDRPTPLVSEGVRKAMVARIAKQGVRDVSVLAAMEAVPRHMFVEPGLASQAYIDASLPIGQHQTISQPYIVARMIEVMRDNQHGGVLNRVLEIGTGCGYQAAVLSLVAKEVYSIERIKPLHELARTNLRPLRVANIRLHYGDGMLGLPQAAPFDGIILAAAGLEVPQALLDQMAIGGRLVAPVGSRQQVLQLIQRISKFEWTSTTLEDCHFVPLRAGTV
ncbi:protein-L-isoaspartate(D-aspartate) O-methyltransferase [Glaciimonas immobilis]|uniref:Protein-L-isoaspartate O-methyltransferase n=1 Tax=Glaciimonas immobilis TaxID=728004 RepID=A0A840RNY0_9BURK|nr:protein-L-isoaspartate(D-aspartate) O-methyltransferase [Glaciimonas immobilis]KAF3998847.1 protein-L-isoaspartate(D-aspartate) O-methyltransferase [Glaciimonas immobilis]MBB5198239.1 protein-L-isoaspartate(D-aspartate) O-methyltransferase [Glaciimonas immobilis]